jgi:phosphoribosylanthranilate isomerase
MPKLFRTKVCGFKTSADIRDAVRAGVEAIGLNFAAESPRSISIDEAQEIIEDVPVLPTVVGVFVNPTPAFVEQVLDRVPLDFVQLHGEEHAEHWRDFRRVPLIKAVRWSSGGERDADILNWHQWLGNRLAAFLVDAAVPGLRGGSGTVADWKSLVPRPTVLAGKPLILAGGLNALNVSSAITAVRPFGVDTASGVESQVGVKDYVKMHAFVQASRSSQV